MMCQALLLRLIKQGLAYAALAPDLQYLPRVI